MHVIVASVNPAKVEAVRVAVAAMFPGTELQVEGLYVPSGVSEQPMTDAETYEGAMNRAENAMKERPDADFWVGIEGGVEEHWCGEMGAFAWVVARSKEGTYGKGRTSMFFVPPKVADMVRGGTGLGAADDIVFGKVNNSEKGGVVGSLTGDVVDRKAYNVQAVAHAFIPFKNPDLY